ncbi:MAG: SdrD B-like domain-containing protein, partial [Planctomycetota bacterium]
PEPDGQPDATATGDDLDIDPANPLPNYPDEDGVQIPVLTAGAVDYITVTVGGGGVVDAWIDFNGDLMWDAAEQIHAGYLGAGNHLIPVRPPAGLAVGQTFARVRISTHGGLSPEGPALDGEVEDHEAYIQPAAAITGTKFHDKDGDRVYDAGEAGVAGWTIYLDDGNGTLDPGEPSTVTGLGGTYTFANLKPGNYIVRELPRAGFVNTFPATGSHPVILSAGMTVSGVDFGNVLLGDANGDCIVGIADLAALADNYGKIGAIWPNGDFNLDGLVGMATSAASWPHLPRRRPTRPLRRRPRPTRACRLRSTVRRRRMPRSTFPSWRSIRTS